MPARLALLALLLSLAAAALVPIHGRIRAPKPGISAEQARSDAVGAARKRDSDLALYDRVIARIRGGESYYDFIVAEQRAAHYPVQPGPAVRLPTLAYLEAGAGPVGQRVAVVVLVLAVLAAWWRRLGEEPGGGGVRRLAAMALLCFGVSRTLDPFYLVLHELWAGLLIALAFGVHRPGRPGGALAALVAAALALAIRELALPFVLLMAAFALARRDWREGAAWSLLAAAFAVALALHFHAIAPHVLPGDRVSAPWLAMRGLSGWLSDVVLSSNLRYLYRPLGGVIVVLAMAGWAGWRSANGVVRLLAAARLRRVLHAPGALGELLLGLDDRAHAVRRARVRAARARLAGPRRVPARRYCATHGAVAQGGAMASPRILLVIGGGIAAYKACELVRTIRRAGGEVACVLTDGGAHFVTAMTLAALSERPVHTTLWDLKNEAEMGHIQLSRQADLLVVCPATADLLAKMAAGIADDLATTLLLATDKPVMAVPAMNVRMWQHAATQANVATLRERGVEVIEPDDGPMACGEFGPGRLPEPAAIWDAIRGALAGSDPLVGQPDFAAAKHRPLHGRHVLVTAGPTHEPIDPVRYIANRSSGRQGFAIAAAAAAAGARVTLIAGPVQQPTPPGVERVDVESAREMAAAVEAALPADVAVMVAAVADWRAARYAAGKLKKNGAAPPALELAENPDILAALARSPQRPPLVVGFAAETENVVANAAAKRTRKQADWIVANDVSGDVMGGAANTVHIVTTDGVESLPEMPKEDVARVLVERIAGALA